jgi:hypothetical protein
MKPSTPTQQPQPSNAMTAMIPGAFVLKMKTPKWRLCVVKQEPDQSASSWMLFGQNKKSGGTFQMEFKSHQETILIRHLINMAEETQAEVRLVLVAESPAISSIESLWQLKGLEMHRKQIDSARALDNALHQNIYMLATSPQTPKMQQSPQSQSGHSMQTRSKKN